VSCFCYFTPGEESCYPLSGCWAGTRFGLDVFRVKKIPSDQNLKCDLKNVIATVSGECLASAALPQGRNPGTHISGCWEGLFEGDPTCRLCRKETETVQHIVCCCEVLAGQRYNVFGNLFVGPKDISTASVRDLCLFI
jgi:hypothetical protein